MAPPVKAPLPEGQQLTTEQIEQLIGPDGSQLAVNQWSRRVQVGPNDKSANRPFPKWDGKNLQSTLREWLREVRVWRQNTNIHQANHGLGFAEQF